MANFKNEDEYLQWCADCVQRIKTATVASNNEIIKLVVGEIYAKTHVSEGDGLYGEGSLKQKVEDFLEDIAEFVEIRHDPSDDWDCGYNAALWYCDRRLKSIIREEVNE